MTEPEAGSDLNAMRTTARRDGDDYIIDGTKHFISKADIADYVILFAATGAEETARGTRQKVSAFLVDMGTPGFTVRDGYRSVSHRGYNNRTLVFEGCRVPARNLLGAEHRGLEVANTWLGTTRLQVAAMCLGRAHRALALATEWAATRKQFGRPIGKFQGVSFQLADMATELAAAEVLTLHVAWKVDQGVATGKDPAMAKLYASEMLARIADRAVQIFGGMGLMEETPVARIWRDARVERIWDGTSEIQRHIISRELLRPYEA
jgi:alkylation response protein AidB-like acyl-CoA dehydrogenase